MKLVDKLVEAIKNINRRSNLEEKNEVKSENKTAVKSENKTEKDHGRNDSRELGHHRS